MSFIWLALVCFEVIPYSLAQLYVATTIGTSFNYACIPLFFEYAVMTAYPASEAVVASFLTAGLNVVAIVFFFIFFIDGIGYKWMNYALILGNNFQI